MENAKNQKFKCDILSNFQTMCKCLKITEKVSFNIASEASNVYVLSGQKLIKNAKNGPFRRAFENMTQFCYKTNSGYFPDPEPQRMSTFSDGISEWRSTHATSIKNLCITTFVIMVVAT